MGAFPRAFETKTAARALTATRFADVLPADENILRDLCEVLAAVETVDPISGPVGLCGEDGPSVRGIMISLDFVPQALEKLPPGRVEGVVGSEAHAGEPHQAIRCYRATPGPLLKRFGT
ncbi:hypothetical protein [Aliiruegeria sabulilitoris]|uniref:hypothetical protein n=1 Tax=Aliiruegeria sabulilitoris TaxID=1510458 RepID=UPI000832FA05|nr:hypothetical protein [Aliiruegeria sabulilitoris]NDR55389.1 hypothetical protein [Pseudoruegeria sp. M32A2M]